MLYSSYGLWRNARMRSWTTVDTAGLVLASSIFIWFTAASRILQSSLKY
jgi:hypothetical protein